MRKQILLIIILCLSAMMVRAERIDVSTARKVAENVANAGSGLRSAGDLTLVYAAAPGKSSSALRSGTVDGAADYFVFNVPGNKGFVIVSGDDRAYPVLGQSDEGNFDPDNLPENLRAILAYYQEQITYADKIDMRASVAMEAEWNRYLSGYLRAATGEVLLPTANWGQGDPFNRQTPLKNGQHAPTGCMATAVGILMKYHGYPEQARPENRVPSYNDLSISYGSYDWNNIPNELTGSSAAEHIGAVSNLLWQVGANMSMRYEPEESSAYIDDALVAMRDVFGYSRQMKHLLQSFSDMDYSWEEWERIIHEELDNGRPVLYGSETETRVDAFYGKAHAFICDGYDTYGRYHINWGWGGMYNGFYVLSSLDPKNDQTWGGYNRGHEMVINIKPNKDSENNASLYVYESAQGNGFEIRTNGKCEDIVMFPIINTGNVPFEGYLTYALTDREGNIKSIGYVNEASIGNTIYGNRHPGNFIVEMSEDDYVMVACSTDKKNWTVIRGLSPEIADMCSVEGPVSDQKVYYDWELDCRNGGLGLEAPGKLEYNKDITVKLVAKPGFTLPKANDISIQEAYYQSISINHAWPQPDYATYNEQTGELYISRIFGHLYISANGIQVSDDVYKYSDTSLASLSYRINGTSIPITLNSEWKSYTVFLPKDLKDRPQVSLEAKAVQGEAKVDITNPVWKGDFAEGKIKITAMNGDDSMIYTVLFKQSDTPDTPGKPATYPVKANLSNLSSSPAIVDATIVKEGEAFSFTLSANSGYMLPTSITIKMSGSTLEAGKGYTYDAKTGKVEILNVRGEVAITAEGVSEPSVYKITAELKNLTSTPAITSATTVKEGESFTFTLKAATNYKLPDAISILKGNDALTAEEFTYDAKTGKVVIKAVSGDLTVKASGIDDRHYEVILNLAGVTSEPASFDPVLVNGKVELTLKAAEGHILPTTITVKMGDKTLVAGTDYTYNTSTGAFSLAKITGKLSITAQGVKKSYSVTATLANITSDIKSDTKVQFGEAFACVLSANEGYTLPTEITVTMGGKTLVDVTDYTYDAATGKISLKKVTGELAITAQGVQKSYAVALMLKDLTSDISQGKKIKHGETLTGKLSVVTPQYGLPSTIEVMMGGKVLAAGSGYSYDPKTGEIEIKNVTAEVSIKASGAEIFQVKEQTENIEIKTSGETVKEGEPFKCELAPATGYKFPYVIKVMMNGRLLKQKNLLRAAGSEYYTYDNTTGIIEIENVDGEIVIEAKGVQEGFFEVIPNLVNLTSDPASFEPLAKDSKVELTLKAASGYTLPTSITVKMGENTLASTDYTYNSGTGAFALEKITATLVITAAGNRIPDPEPEPEPTPTTYMVTLPVVEGATLIAESSTNVESGKSFAFTLTLKDGYSAPQLTVKANGSVLGPVSSGRYVIEKVTSNIVVTVTGIVKDNPTDNAEVDPNGLRVWGENGRLHIQTPVMDTACIVTFEGRLYRNLSLPVGETITSIPQGSYIIYIGNQSYKIRF